MVRYLMEQRVYAQNYEVFKRHGVFIDDFMGFFFEDHECTPALSHAISELFGTTDPDMFLNMCQNPPVKE